MVREVNQPVVLLLIEQEKKCAELYALFAERYPELREFWELMAGEERRHAAAISELVGKIASGGVSFFEGKSRGSTLQAFIDYLQGVIDKAGREQLPLATALSLALDIEKSLFEKKGFDHFEEASPEVADTLGMLRRETSEHIRRLEAMWQERRNKP